jgi:hypothetical protein
LFIFFIRKIISLDTAPSSTYTSTTRTFNAKEAEMNPDLPQDPDRFSQALDRLIANRKLPAAALRITVGISVVASLAGGVGLIAILASTLVPRPQIFPYAAAFTLLALAAILSANIAFIAAAILLARNSTEMAAQAGQAKDAVVAELRFIMKLTDMLKLLGGVDNLLSDQIRGTIIQDIGELAAVVGDDPDGVRFVAELRAWLLGEGPSLS